jgi:hypothetical protein
LKVFLGAFLNVASSEHFLLGLLVGVDLGLSCGHIRRVTGLEKPSSNISRQIDAPSR